MIDNSDATASPKSSAKQIRWQRFLGLLIGAAVVFFMLRHSNIGGHRASRPEVLGRWEHQGKDVTLLLELRDDGKFDRRPKMADIWSGTWGTSIPESGEWRINENGVLVFVGGGSFIPYRQGDTLNLKAEMDSSVVFQFSRKP
jgi:hypothetical protein